MSNEGKSFTSVGINWYPGHMAKAKRLIKENLKLVDIVFEVIDSRVPKSSKITDLIEIVGNKPVVLVFTKYDLCDKNETNKFIERYESNNYYVLKYDLTKSINTNELVSKCNLVLKDKIDNFKNKGINKNKIRALVIGVPNAGKSTLINKIVGKNTQTTGNKPGVTKSLNWVRIGENLELLDSPGVLWPKFETEEESLNLASTTAIKEEVIPKESVAVYIIKFLYNYYPNILKDKYGITDIEDFDEVYTTIAKNKGFVMRGAEPDYDRVTDLIINDIKQGKVSGITFDRFKND